MQGLTPAQALLHHARTTPSHTAVVMGQSHISYLQLAGHVALLARHLHDSGVREGTVVGIHTDRNYHTLVLLLALDVRRAVPAYLSAADLADPAWINRCDMVLVDGPPAAQLPGARFVSIAGNWLNAIIGDAARTPDLASLHHVAEPGDFVFLGGTSSTTGDRKYFLDTRAAMQSQLELMRNQFFAQPSTNFICRYTVWLGAAYAGCFIALLSGSTIVFSSGDDFLDCVMRYPGSHSALVLRDADQLTRTATDIPEAVRLSSLRVIGAHLPDSVRSWLESHLARRVVNSYSSNETGQIGEVLPDGSTAIYEGVSVRIVDDQRRDVDWGQVGIIAVKTPGMIQGYSWNEPLTRRHFEDGWFFSSDLGRMTPQGRLTVVGRADDMLNLGGVKIAPAPYELAIRDIPGVSDCVLLSDAERFGVGRLVVCVETLAGIAPAAVFEQVRGVVRKHFKTYTVHVLDAFPRTETGKVRRADLKALLPAG